MTKRYEVIVRHQAQREVEEIYDYQHGIDPARAERFRGMASLLSAVGKQPLACEAERTVRP